MADKNHMDVLKEKEERKKEIYFFPTKLQHLLINIIIGVTLQFFVASSSIGIWSCIVLMY